MSVLDGFAERLEDELVRAAGDDGMFRHAECYAVPNSQVVNVSCFFFHDADLTFYVTFDSPLKARDGIVPTEVVSGVELVDPDTRKVSGFTIARPFSDWTDMYEMDVAGLVEGVARELEKMAATYN